MSDLWRLAAPWWTISLRCLLVYGALLLFIRLSGRRTLGDFTPFDLVVMILIGDASQNGMIGDDHSVPGAFIAGGTLIAANYVVGWITARVPAFERMVEGRPVLIAKDGVVLKDILRRNNISDAEFEEALRDARCLLQDVWLGLLEPNGSITILKQGECAPVGAWHVAPPGPAGREPGR